MITIILLKWEASKYKTTAIAVAATNLTAAMRFLRNMQLNHGCGYSYHSITKLYTDSHFTSPISQMNYSALDRLLSERLMSLGINGDQLRKPLNTIMP